VTLPRADEGGVGWLQRGALLVVSGQFELRPDSHHLLRNVSVSLVESLVSLITDADDGPFPPDSPKVNFSLDHNLVMADCGVYGEWIEEEEDQRITTPGGRGQPADAPNSPELKVGCEPGQRK
jgi:hypothetical protein